MPRHNQDLLDRLLSGLSIRGFLLHPATLFALATSALIGGAIFLWGGYQDKIVSHDEYRLTENKIRLTTPPVWANIDLKKLILTDANENEASILDTNLVPRTAEVFRNVGFVERIRKIEKSKSGLDVELVYRQPVALVELSELTMPRKWPKENRGKKVLLPVDGYGIVMPESVGKLQKLPTIMVAFPKQFANLATWSDWPDDRIKDAAAIVSKFQQPLSEIGIAYVATVHYKQSDSVARKTIPFRLWSGSGTKIIWGNAPGKELPNEASAAQKIEAINLIVAKYGALDKSDLGQIDVRSGKPVPSQDSKTAQNPNEMFLELK